MAKSPNISFIPKKPLAHDLSGGKRPFSLLLGSAIGILVFVWGAWGGLYIYHGVLQNDIDQKKADLQELNGKFNKDVVAKARDIEHQLTLGKQILNRHTVTIPLFDMLAKDIPRNTYFTSFQLEKGGQTSTSTDYFITLNGLASGFSDVASLRDALQGEEDTFKNIEFTDVGLNNKGYVTFSIKGALDTAFSSYVEREKKAANSVSTGYFSANGFGGLGSRTATSTQ